MHVYYAHPDRNRTRGRYCLEQQEDSSMLIRFMRVAALVVASTLLAAAGQSQSPETMFEAARKLEVIDGDFRGAIKLYETVVGSNADRSAKARALLRMGECYQKLGDEQATKVFERIVREFGDQKQAAQAASARLGGFGADAASGMTSRQVWTGPQVDVLGMVAGDGRYIAHRDFVTGDVMLRDLATGSSRRLTDNGPPTQSSSFAEQSVMSRNGSQIAYSWYTPSTDRYELRILKSDATPAASAPRVLFSNPEVAWIAPYDWSADGKRLAVQLARLDGASQIGVVSVTDGSYQPLKSTVWQGASQMFFSPDGSLVAYDLPQPGSNDLRDVYVMHVDGSREVTVAPHPGNDKVVGWSPDGNTVVFASDRAGSMGLWLVPIANGRSSGAPTLVKSDMGALERSLGVTRHGTLAYAVRTGTPRVVVVGMDFQTGKRLSQPVFPFETYLSRVNQSDWSADGQLIVARLESLRRRAGLTIRKQDGARVRDLSVDLAYFQRPGWAPDGSITVQGFDAKGRQGLFRIDAESGVASPIVLSDPPASVGWAGWTPDGKSVVFRRNGEKAVSVVVRDIASGQERTIAEQMLAGLSVSPDGRHVAYLVYDPAGKTTTVNTMSIEAGTPAVVAKVAGRARNVTAWTPDGRSIVWGIAGDTSKPSLWTVAAAGGTPQKLAIDDFNGGIYMRVHPDGRHIIYETGTLTHEIWTLENFLPSRVTTSSRR
jgi:Tol biopolymer transport system component